MKKLKAAVIGCGAIAHHCHIPGYKSSKYTEIVAVADPTEQNRNSAMEKFDIPRGYPDADALFANEDVDIVSVCTPNAYHAATAIKAVQAGCHVICEKPLCLNLREAAAVEKAVQKSDKVFMVAFTHRFFYAVQKAKEYVDKGRLGTPYMIRIRFAHQGPMEGWAMTNSFYRPDQAGGGALFDMGIHAIDLAGFFMGPIERINAMMGTFEKDMPMEDNAILQFGFASGKLGYADVGWTSKQGFTGFEIFGSDAALVMDYTAGVFYIQGQTSAAGKHVVKKKPIYKGEPLAGGWPAQMEYFINIVRKNGKPETDVSTGVTALKIALAAYESAQKGKMITIK